ncbi:hypothetical protein [Nibricoccus aquaticus]|uniref:hypothetical protein n=1 Tax=Nibricoccus aquaticus TaxID=2576891 RepID=UPI0010FEF21D|nr:hypothetical protein [Nibricoccus aquaticus]
MSLIAATAGALIAVESGASDKAAVDVDMSQYVVRADRVLPQPESWRYVLVPAGVLERGKKVVVASGYEVLSNLSEKNTRVFVEELQRRQLAGTILWPTIIEALPREPMIVVLDRTRQAFMPADVDVAQSWESDAISTPEHTSEGFVSFEVADAGPEMDSRLTAIGRSSSYGTMGTRYGGDVPMKSGTFDGAFDSPKLMRPLSAGVVVLRARDGVVATLINADSPAGMSRLGEEMIAAGLSKEAAVFGMRSMSNPPPLWFREGMGWLVYTSEVSRKKIAFAGVAVDFTGQLVPSLLTVFQKTEKLSFNEVMLAGAFTHYCLYGNNRKLAPNFIQFMERLEREPVSEQLFKECFRRTTKKMEVELASQGRGMAAFASMELKGRLPELPAFSIREATQSEVARLKADAFITQGLWDQALDVLRIAYWRGEREPEMLAVLATLEERVGSVERARKLSKALMALPKPPARILIVEAKLRYRKALEGKAEGEKLTVAQIQPVLTLLAQAVKAGQNTETLWAFFSEVVLRGEGKPHASTGGYLVKAAERYPRNSIIREAARKAEGAL